MIHGRDASVGVTMKGMTTNRCHARNEEYFFGVASYVFVHCSVVQKAIDTGTETICSCYDFAFNYR